MKTVGFHTFRHTYTTLLTQNNEDVKVVQELLRHANSRITLDLYEQRECRETIGTEQGCTDGAGQEVGSCLIPGPQLDQKVRKAESFSDASILI
jgi:hypothetical protein